MKTFKTFIKEDGMISGGPPTNNVGSGQIAGTGVTNPTKTGQSEPGYRKKIRIIRRRVV